MSFRKVIACATVVLVSGLSSISTKPAFGTAEACCIPNAGGSHLNPTCVMVDPDLCSSYGSDRFGHGESQGAGTNCVDSADADDVAEVCEHMMPGGNARAGTNLFTTVDGSWYDWQGLGGIPADFFGPGSDPFTGSVALVGQPFDETGPLSTTDTIIQRHEEAVLPDCVSAPVDEIAIEIVALSLRSIDPVTVTYNGGQNPEQWDLHVCLSDVPPGPGAMTVQQCLLDGGVCSWSYPMQLKFVFTRLGSPGDVRILDTGLAGIQPDLVLSGMIPWVYWDPQVHSAAAPDMIVDGNCDEVPDAPLPDTSNLVAGVGHTICSCLPQTEPRQRDPIVNTFPWGEHHLVPTAGGVEGGVIPAISEWGVVAFALLLLTFGTAQIRRRAHAAPTSAG